MDTRHAVKITAPIFVPHKVIHDVLICANEQACGYWASQTEHKCGPAPEWLGEWARNEDGSPRWPWHVAALTNGGSVTYIEDEEGVEHVLTYSKIVEGLRVMADRYDRHFRDLVDENHDAITADVFLQCCLLGETVYG